MSLTPSKITSYGSLGFLAGTGIYKLAKNERYDSETLEAIRKNELAILAIASGQYIISMRMPVHRLQKWRYMDWIITTPLLLRSFHLLAVEKGFTESFVPALSANIAMIVFGYLAEFPNVIDRKREKRGIAARTKQQIENYRRTLYVLSIVTLLVIFYFVRRWDNFLKSKGVDTGRLTYFFYYGWSLYGLNFLNPDQELKQTTFNILDSINKGLFTLELDKVIRENL
jgi:bacteriorhodopsin